MNGLLACVGASNLRAISYLFLEVPEHQAMAAMRGSSCIIQNTCKALSFRQFHYVPLSAAKQKPKISPRVASTLRVSPSIARVQKTYKPEECLPPLALLQAGSKSGAVPIDPHTTSKLLLRYQELAEKPTTGWERNLCTGKQSLQCFVLRHAD